MADIRAVQQGWESLERELRQKKPNAKARPPRGTYTPSKTYRLPILRALIAFGGKARKSQVLEKVYAEMEPHLKPDDFKLVSSDNTPVWRNWVGWERKHMVDEGLLRNDSPHGIWEITETGRAYLAQQDG